MNMYLYDMLDEIEREQAYNAELKHRESSRLSHEQSVYEHVERGMSEYKEERE